MKAVFCLVLCLVALLPAAFSDQQNSENYEAIRQAESIANNEKDIISNLADSNQNVEWTLKDDCTLRKALEHLLTRDMVLSPTFRTLDPIGGGHLLRRDTMLDSIGGGHLLKRDSALDSIGGGHLLKRDSALDSIGGGHLLKKRNELRQLDSIGGGHLLKRDNRIRQLDPIGGGNLLKRRYAMYGPFGGGYYPRNRFTLWEPILRGYIDNEMGGRD